MAETKNIVVFGGAGFVGTHLLRRLSGDIGNKLICVDIKDPRVRLDNVEYLRHDIREDLSNINIAGSVELIYNLAAIHTTPGHLTEEYYETNIAGATNIASFASQKSAKAIIFTSSISVYGPSEECKTELTALAPASAYGWSKSLAEGIHRAWLIGDPERRLIICRPAVIFGHGEGGNFTRMASLLRRGIFIYPGRKDTIKACFYVEDLLTTFEYALAQRDRLIIYNACYPDGYTLEQIVEAFREQAYGSAKTFVLPKLLVLAAAKMLEPLSNSGLGIHPDRVAKLLRSTNIMPTWLQSNGMAPTGQLPIALGKWQSESADFV